MSAEKNPAQKRRWNPSARAVCLFIVLGTFGCMLVVRHLGLLQFLEFQAYDFFLRSQKPGSGEDPIVLVEMTEEDIQNPTLDYPLYDSVLADLLRRLLGGNPAAIGLDIWRDIPVPKNGVGLEELGQVLATNGNICAIFTRGSPGKGDGIQPPKILGMDPSRVAFNDNFPPDIQVDATVPKVRRTLLFGGENEGFSSLPFWLAGYYLQTVKNIEIAADKDGIQLGKTKIKRFKSNDGAYVGADATEFNMLLDFKRPADFTRFSIIQTLAGEIPEGALEGKIVIIGINSASVSDERVTPISHNHRGPELQASAVNQLLRIALDGDEPIKTLSDWQEDFLMLLWCVIGGIVGFRAHSPWRFAFDCIVWLLVIAVTGWVAFSSGWWVPMAAPMLAFIPASILVTTFITAQERSMRATLMKLYSRHVSKEIAEETWANRDSFMSGGRPRAQKVTVTVLFTDLKGFSTVSEKMDPGELYAWLNGYLGTMADIVLAHGGILKQFTGDGILALFGVPVPHSKLEEQQADAAAAVDCALAMGRRLIELIKTWEAEGLPKVSMRAGIYTGEAAAGHIGDDKRFEYAVIGDVVNTASRLESYDKNFADPDKLPNRCRILIGESTHALLNGNYVSKVIGLLEVKGKAKKVSVYQILDEEMQTAPVDAVPAKQLD